MHCLRFISSRLSSFLYCINVWIRRYPWHLGQHTTQNLNPTPGIACGINLKYKMLPEVLKQANYTTWAFGKWHLGYLTDQFVPTGRGFDRYVGYYSGAEDHFTKGKTGPGVDNQTAVQYYDLSNNTNLNGQQSINSCLEHVGNASATYSSYLYGNETLRLLDQHDPNDPLYVYLAWANVHSPNQAPQQYLDLLSDIQDVGRRGLAGMMSALDDQLNDVVDKLKEKGMWENSFVLVTTDNGGNLAGSGINYPLRGGKYTFWQGGVKGIGFVTGGLVPESLRGSSWSGFAHAADWYTTFANLAGVSLKDSGPVEADGVDLSQPLLQNLTSPRQEVVLQIISNSSGNDYIGPPNAYCEAIRGTDEYHHCDIVKSLTKTSKYLYRPTNIRDETTIDQDSNTNNNKLEKEGETEVLTCGVLIQGRYKLIWGYPGWNPTPEYDGWVIPPSLSGPEASTPNTLPLSDDKPCGVNACLYDLNVDPTEHVDIAANHTDVVEAMKKRILQLLETEVTLKAANLCPTNIGSMIDPRLPELAGKIGFWQPWLPPLNLDY